MKKAEMHPLESKRIAALKSLNILDTLPEVEYDQITFLASQICNTPIALISLVDEKRQWFKSKVGLNASETSRDLAFCAHAILLNDVLEIKDSEKDERFYDNPLATDAPHVKFYAGAPLLAPSGDPIGTVCVIDSVARSLSENQKESLRALSSQVTRLLELRLQVQEAKEANEKLAFRQTAIETIAEGMVVQDSAGAIIDFNKSALDILGLSADELTGKTSFDPSWRAVDVDGNALQGEDHPAIKCLKHGERQNNFVMGVYSASSQMRWININSVPLFLNDSSAASHAVTSFTDITLFKTLEDTRRTLEMRLMEGSKLSALGIMAGGLAHEINNPLTILRARIAVLKKSMKESASQYSSDFEVIDKTLMRIERIVKGLKMYSRESVEDPFERVSVLSILEDTFSVCMEKLKLESIKVDLKVAPELEIKCHPSEISQIILNLIMNSRDAIIEMMPEAHWISIDAKLVGNAWVEIGITDGGSGIEEKVVKKIMDPFFTTKEVGKGTGLGLSLSLGLAREHGGDLYYDALSKNTRFVLKIPAA